MNVRVNPQRFFHPRLTLYGFKMKASITLKRFQRLSEMGTPRFVPITIMYVHA
jgi:hypothetical protein